MNPRLYNDPILLSHSISNTLNIRHQNFQSKYEKELKRERLFGIMGSRTNVLVGGLRMGIERLSFSDFCRMYDSEHAC
ncbi:hypothetical protein, partial [Cohnella thermotolerans]|uniref:hypothetical protein n=1 Tax=Cohnella thermotolerans TaxID=329858 RepID=UPI001F0ADB79